MATHALVRLAAQQIEGPHAGPAARQVAADLPGPRREQKGLLEGQHESPLQRTERPEVREDAEMIDAPRLGEGHDAVQQVAGLEAHVAVHEQQPPPRRPPRPGVAGVALPDPAGRQLADVDHLEARPAPGRRSTVRLREAIEEGARPVARAIVDDDHLETGVVLRQRQAHGALAP